MKIFSFILALIFASSYAQHNCSISQNASTLCATSACLWTDASLWEDCNSTFPGALVEDAFVNTPGTYSLLINESLEIGTVYIGTGAKQVNYTEISVSVEGSIQFVADFITILNHAVLEINIDSTDADNFFGGADGNADISISNGGLIDWISGTIGALNPNAFANLINVLPGGVLVVESGSKLLNQVGILNAGSLIILDGADLQLNSSVINSTQEVHFNGSSTISGFEFLSYGETNFYLDSDDTVTLDVGAYFYESVVISNGSLDITNPSHNAGTYFHNLTIEDGATVNISGSGGLAISGLVNNGLLIDYLDITIGMSGTLFNGPTGSILLQSEVTLIGTQTNEGAIENQGSIHISGNATFGSMNFTNCGLLQVDENVSFQSFVYDGRLSGDGTITVENEFVWLSGEIDNEPELTLLNSTHFELHSDAVKNLTNSLALIGGTALFNGSLTFGTGVTLSLSSSTITTCIGAVFDQVGTSASTIVNYGGLSGDFTLSGVGLENYGAIGLYVSSPMIISDAQLSLANTSAIYLNVESATLYSRLSTPNTAVILNGSLEITVGGFSLSGDSNFTLVDFSGASSVVGNFTSITVKTSDKLTCTSANATRNGTSITLSLSGCTHDDPSKDDNGNKKKVIIGVSVSVGAVLVLLFAFVLYRRRQRHHHGEKDSLLKHEGGGGRY
eukprot:TRINITY_DN295_c0_g1_i1.p1 TRINITY_DN295_c0_g1~~TRINITY_DN295_c0_g1_i1.p1  ORF type:complete len:677 (-),score=210.05 TRINITY_DN295_c0_g1_i1:82-2112(-)